MIFDQAREIRIPRIHIQSDPFCNIFWLMPWRCVLQPWRSLFSLIPQTLHREDGTDAMFSSTLEMQLNTKGELNQQI